MSSDKGLPLLPVFLKVVMGGLGPVATLHPTYNPDWQTMISLLFSKRTLADLTHLASLGFVLADRGRGLRWMNLMIKPVLGSLHLRKCQLAGREGFVLPASRRPFRWLCAALCLVRETSCSDCARSFQENDMTFREVRIFSHF